MNGRSTATDHPIAVARRQDGEMPTSASGSSAGDRSGSAHIRQYVRPIRASICADMGGSIRGRGGEMVLIGLAARPGEVHMFDRVESRAMLPAGDRPTGEA
jgi:hypothetical protein